MAVKEVWAVTLSGGDTHEKRQAARAQAKDEGLRYIYEFPLSREAEAREFAFNLTGKHGLKYTVGRRAYL